MSFLPPPRLHASFLTANSPPLADPVFREQYVYLVLYPFSILTFWHRLQVASLASSATQHIVRPPRDMSLMSTATGNLVKEPTWINDGLVL